MEFVQVSALCNQQQKIAAIKNCKNYWVAPSLRILGFSKKISRNIWYIGLKFSEITEIVMLFQYSEISFY